MKMVGERPLNAVVEGVAEVRKGKIKEAYEKATVKAKAGAAPLPRTAAPPSAAPPSKKKPTVQKPSSSVNDEEPTVAPPPLKKVTKPPARLTVG
jgi:cytoskeleton-associated protein 5